MPIVKIPVKFVPCFELVNSSEHFSANRFAPTRGKTTRMLDSPWNEKSTNYIIFSTTTPCFTSRLCQFKIISIMKDDRSRLHCHCFERLFFWNILCTGTKSCQALCRSLIEDINSNFLLLTFLPTELASASNPLTAAEH